MKKIPFMKFSGAGNDFIVIDNRDRVIQPKAMASFVSHVCRHHLSVGADGLIFIEKSRKADFRWRFFNDDGGEATFCGNGARCAARFAYLKKIAPKAMRFEGTAGTVEAEVHGYRVTVGPKSGLPLIVTFRRDGERFTVVTLTGEARAIYDGLMRSDAWEYELL